jgi:transcription-repair coupling factor (superfamily II helicase)
VSDLEVGEFVVHVDHGIGRFQGLTRMTDPNRGEREYLDIAYAESGRLLVPVEHADRVTRYIGAGEAVPSLTRLGSGEWQRTRRRIRSAVQRIAKDLVELYARRELAEAPPIPQDTTWQMELEASFPFLETPDQLQATSEVKDDLEQPRPMDRLLVGDVGYGKTEVALRAAFKVVMAGKQVAVLVPTTVLAQQHFNTFRERLAPFPARVEMLSRFLTDKQARAVLAGLKDGSIDIVIGTHRLIQKDVEFKNLGLVILDEEQRFGVSHKERFKELRTEVHVLTLSATPIPRTLHLSLVGVRDLSMIQTPPEERLPIRTYVGEHDEGMVREAILRELDRGGQIYYVYNRVQSIHTVAARLAALVPEARILIGHGQMDDDELEDTMLRFAAGDGDVLVCTTIIEAGLDLPNVNTIVVSNAHQFGLSQLYQLRGRVGRSSARAYAYFLYPQDRQLTELAEKRLRAIFEATELGAGYRIALKDLEIRGAGNLLGVEQHGHISAVGFDLYCKLLGEAVEQLKSLHAQATDVSAVADRVLSGVLEERPTASVSLPLDASLPADYVTDDSIRLNLYQRLAEIVEPEQAGELMEEIEDRFGSLPEAAMNLFYLADLRLSAAAAGVEEIVTDGNEIVVRFREARSVNAAALSRAAGTQVRARANQVRFAVGKSSDWLRVLPALIAALQQDTVSAASPGA